MDIEKKEEEKKNSHSIYAYTALIFIVAMIMIILAFFGQSNLDKSQETQSEGKTIAEKSAVISEENFMLHDKITDLQEQLEQAEIELTSEKEINKINSSLISAQILYNIGNLQAANETLSTIDETVLKDDSLTIYQNLKENIAAKLAANNE